MSNLTLIKMPDNSVIWQAIANYSDTKNATDLIFLYEDKRESHMKNSVSAALALAACALVLSCYSCCCFNRFSVRSRRSQVLLTRALSASNERFRRNAARRTAARNAFGSNGQNNCQDRANNTDQPDVIRRFDLDVESLPSYTIVSGLPTYDDALEQFRKAGIIITHPSIVKIFEEIKSAENTENADNVSISSTCTCGAASTIAGTSSPTPSTTTTATISPVIELSPEQLRILSKKRLSLQIALNSSVRSTNRGGRIDLCREVNRSNLLRSHDIPQIHRSTSSLSNERSIFAQRLSQAQHRGSLA